MEKILIVDDEKEIRDLIEIYLKSEGYEIFKSENGLEALEILNREEIDLVILDVMMPKLDGIQTCIKIREKSELPVIMLSAKSEDIDKIFGLNMGADDYISKPFNALELIARVKSHLRKYNRYKNMSSYSEGVKLENEIVIDDLVIKLDLHQVYKGDELIKLTPTEFEIITLLAKNKGKVFSIANIYESVWKQEYLESDNTVMVHIRKIREKVEEDSRKPRFIKTVWGVGYKIDK
ncbi:response regulator transcription factor [Clostridium thermobutyricum]|uniref:Stage 0 sporulation protein A homolog n=1 Tax=Clostridium thermobutyricum DSM 4928 TaxID=1121339 RepID=A0A1V4SWJ0_9CLOT|nr:response regulator transcription factor [Clostridium thermobutyricum]OPX48631.1 transcriptional regulatory protein WalR [Clostridium thermobutyricum DSM 4928]